MRGVRRKAFYLGRLSSDPGFPKCVKRGRLAQLLSGLTKSLAVGINPSFRVSFPECEGGQSHFAAGGTKLGAATCTGGSSSEKRREMPERNILIFLSHASSDKSLVRRVNRDLQSRTFQTWLDE